MPKKPEVRLPRLPNEKEEKIGPEMDGYIFQELLLVPKEGSIYLLFNRRPAWITDLHLGANSCANYSGNISATFEMMKKLRVVRPNLYERTVDYLCRGRGAFNFFNGGGVLAAFYLCHSVVQLAKEMVIKAESAEKKK